MFTYFIKTFVRDTTLLDCMLRTIGITGVAAAIAIANGIIYFFEIIPQSGVAAASIFYLEKR